MKITPIFFLLWVSACSVSGSARPDADAIANASNSPDLGVIPIGATSVDFGAFISTDCTEKDRLGSDCSATDSDGRHYAFFNGALSMVSAGAVDTSIRVKLPAGMQFGENIHEAARKATTVFHTKFDVGVVDGVIAYSSLMNIPSHFGIFYSIELIADKDGRLAKVIQRTDF